MFTIHEGIEFFTEFFKYKDAWLVGSAAKSYSNMDIGRVPKDFDILLQEQWYPYFPVSWGKHRKNTYGGLEYKTDNFELDVWLGNIGTYLRKVSWGDKGIALHLATRCILTTDEYPENKVITDRETYPRLVRE